MTNLDIIKFATAARKTDAAQRLSTNPSSKSCSARWKVSQVANVANQKVETKEEVKRRQRFGHNSCIAFKKTAYFQGDCDGRSSYTVFKQRLKKHYDGYMFRLQVKQLGQNYSTTEKQVQAFNMAHLYDKGVARGNVGHKPKLRQTRLKRIVRMIR